MNMAKGNLFYQSGDCAMELNKFIQNTSQSFFQEIQDWASGRPKQADFVKIEYTKQSWEATEESLTIVYKFLNKNKVDVYNYISDEIVEWVSIFILVNVTLLFSNFHPSQWNTIQKKWPKIHYPKLTSPLSNQINVNYFPLHSYFQEVLCNFLYFSV